MLSSAKIQEFTVFRKADFEFVPGINVLVGANATGKTHLLKLLYGLQFAQFEQSHIASHLQYLFRPESPDDLISKGARPRRARASSVWDETSFPVAIDSSGYQPGDIHWTGVTRPVFIPAKDMLANSVGFLSLYDQRFIDFDQTYRDILTLAFTPTLRDTAKNGMASLMELLESRLEGKVELRGERFYLTGERGSFAMHLVAEGWRKLALLYRLIANGSITAGTVLYWDEPEANLNPTLMGDVVSVLLELSRVGVQIFLATHSYVILKELDLQRKASDTLRLFAFERKKDGSAAVHPADNYIDLHPNLIADQFKHIYTAEVQRTLRTRNGG